MQPRKQTDPQRQARLLAELRRDNEIRQKGYRAQALKILPHICGICGREFEGKRLSELTVHHKDLNYKNNPPDGSNWELLCTYCHEDVHADQSGTDYHDDPTPTNGRERSPIVNPFAGLDSLVKPADPVPGPAAGDAQQGNATPDPKQT